MRIHSGLSYIYEFSTPREEIGFTMTRGRLRDYGKRWTGLSPFAIGKKPADADLIHSYNGIPLGSKPFVISGESFIPRLKEGRRSALPAKWLAQRMLVSDRCRSIHPISENAAKIVRDWNRGAADYDRLIGKIEVVYPSVPKIEPLPERDAPGNGPLELVFVGNHFGRKGGIACLLLSDLLTDAGIDHRLNIIGRQEAHEGIWTDTSADYYRDMMRKERPNVRFTGRIPNEEVLDILRRAHFTLLPTLDDTFGFSVLEAMTFGCVPIVSGIRALPEVVEDDRSGVLLDVETDSLDRWKYLTRDPAQRLTDAYRKRIDDTQHRFAADMKAAILRIMDDPALYGRMSRRSHEIVSERHHPTLQSEKWRDIYQRALA